MGSGTSELLASERESATSHSQESTPVLQVDWRLYVNERSRYRGDSNPPRAGPGRRGTGMRV